MYEVMDGIVIEINNRVVSVEVGEFDKAFSVRIHPVADYSHLSFGEKFTQLHYSYTYLFHRYSLLSRQA